MHIFYFKSRNQNSLWTSCSLGCCNCLKSHSKTCSGGDWRAEWAINIWYTMFTLKCNEVYVSEVSERWWVNFYFWPHYFLHVSHTDWRRSRKFTEKAGGIVSSSVLYVCLYSVSLDSALQVMAVMAVLVLILATKFSISKLVVCVWCLFSKAEKFLVLSV